MRRSLRPNAYLRLVENRFVGSASSASSICNPGTPASIRLPSLCSPIASCRSGSASTLRVKHDSTAIVAVTWDDDKPRLVAHRVFQPRPDDPIDFELTVERTLLDFNKRFCVQKVLFDPVHASSVMQRLSREGIDVEEFPQTTGNLTDASAEPLRGDSRPQHRRLSGRRHSPRDQPRDRDRDEPRLADREGQAKSQDRRRCRARDGRARLRACSERILRTTLDALGRVDGWSPPR